MVVLKRVVVKKSGGGGGGGRGRGKGTIVKFTLLGPTGAAVDMAAHRREEGAAARSDSAVALSMVVVRARQATSVARITTHVTTAASRSG